MNTIDTADQAQKIILRISEQKTELLSLFEHTDFAITGKLKEVQNVFVVGIGGSNLASKALYDAIIGKKFIIATPKLFFIESPDKEEREIIDQLIREKSASNEKFAIIAISKSGETKETIESFTYIFDTLKEKYDVMSEYSLVITEDKEGGSTLSNLARERAVPVEAWPTGIGGRYSAFTKAHLIPMVLSGLNVETFCSTAKQTAELCLSENMEENESFKFAMDLGSAYKQGINILDLFFFENELETLGKWVRQLVAESVGKVDTNGTSIGISPEVSIGPRDLHSILQLILAGPKNRFTLFAISEEADGINREAYASTTRAFYDNNLPFVEYKFENIDESSLAKFMTFMMFTVIYLSWILMIDPFNQPEVEKYKSNIT